MTSQDGGFTRERTDGCGTNIVVHDRAKHYALKEKLTNEDGVLQKQAENMLDDMLKSLSINSETASPTHAESIQKIREDALADALWQSQQRRVKSAAALPSDTAVVSAADGGVQTHGGTIVVPTTDAEIEHVAVEWQEVPHLSSTGAGPSVKLSDDTTVEDFNKWADPKFFSEEATPSIPDSLSSIEEVWFRQSMPAAALVCSFKEGRREFVVYENFNGSVLGRGNEGVVFSLPIVTPEMHCDPTPNVETKWKRIGLTDGQDSKFFPLYSEYLFKKYILAIKNLKFHTILQPDGSIPAMDPMTFADMKKETRGEGGGGGSGEGGGAKSKRRHRE